eukprot:TRINITY_DN68416_c0_g1_i1.p1 TRINITY_DN68416_c0_g1~~TRINITY_DN68416_c0_g1_i1.p1  ORF type:complete len:666 (-),score=73.17 TRINITY_DN68416_c0_g1_i1:153-2150(-)
MATACTSCAAEIPEGKCFSEYSCRQGHSFQCCKGECHRSFEKRCTKVSDAFRKRQQKLMNDGQSPPVRRVQASEREKLKQYLEAEKTGSLICPKSCTVEHRSVAHCSYILFQTKSPQFEESHTVDDRESTTAQNPKVQAETNLLGDDMLLELKRNDCDEGEDGILKSGKSKKAQKGEKSRKGQKLILDFKTPSINASCVDSTGRATAPQDSPMQSQAASPWLASLAATAPQQQPQTQTVPRQQTAPLMDQPSPWECSQRVKTLMTTTGCSAQKAQDLLETTGWNLNAAAELYFKHAQQVSEPRWGLRVGPSPQQATLKQPQPQQIQSQGRAAEIRGIDDDETAQVAEVVPQESALPTLAAPAHPPPPPLPADWVAQWCQEESAYYYWHKPTNQTTWDAPMEERDQRRAPTDTPCSVVDVHAEVNTNALRATDGVGNFNSTLQGGSRVGYEQNGDQPECQQTVHAHSQWDDRNAVQLSPERGACGRDETEGCLAANKAAARQNERLRKLGQRVCTRHWKPKAEAQGCLRLLQGERLEVTWAADDDGAWAYGHAVDDETKRGYFPQSLLSVVTREPRQRALGERCLALQGFIAPDEIGGYLSIQRGDTLQVLHPLDFPYVWAYVGKVGQHGMLPAESGWVPECTLCEPIELNNHEISGHGVCQQLAG